MASQVKVMRHGRLVQFPTQAPMIIEVGIRGIPGARGKSGASTWTEIAGKPLDVHCFNEARMRNSLMPTYGLVEQPDIPDIPVVDTTAVLGIAKLGTMIL